MSAACPESRPRGHHACRFGLLSATRGRFGLLSVRAAGGCRGTPHSFLARTLARRRAGCHDVHTMIRLSPPVLPKSIGLIILMSLMTGLLLSRFVAPLFAARPLPWLWAALTVAMCEGLMLSAITVVTFPRVMWVEPGCTVHVRGRTVPVLQLTRIHRKLSGKGSSQYLTYTFVPEGGPKFRMLMTGEPFTALDADGVATLRRFAGSLAGAFASDSADAPLHSGLAGKRGTTEAGPRELIADLATLDVRSAASGSAA
ncbi:hypothetical protein [Agromyces archimandritae]|uniref:Uncharacterized protein n=1 Tax=Agromyces archimandritae TaxID=2781962 RepID=A0A975IPQ3_9MICO|nr:hypothetical protein [Agromyces archimandritae]QTX05840.1 hypothetical protein G127AT_06485 [Agromyces archimandritae]